MKKRLRIFAGPNGSGKSTLYEAFSKNYNTGHFVNADYIENILDTKGFIDLEKYGIKAIQKDLENFYNEKNAASLLQKSALAGHKIDVEIKENFIVDPSKESHSYEGSLVASFLRNQLIKANQSFSYETVMSHVAKLEEINEAKASGYSTYLYFVCIDDPEVNISRVENRVQKGGHAVDEDKIVERYSRTLENLFPAIEICDKVYLFDNSGEELILIAEIQKGKSLTLHIDQEQFPNWFEIYVLKYFV